MSAINAYVYAIKVSHTSPPINERCRRLALAASKLASGSSSPHNFLAFSHLIRLPVPRGDPRGLMLLLLLVLLVLLRGAAVVLVVVPDDLPLVGLVPSSGHQGHHAVLHLVEKLRI